MLPVPEWLHSPGHIFSSDDMDTPSAVKRKRRWKQTHIPCESLCEHWTLFPVTYVIVWLAEGKLSWFTLKHLAGASMTRSPPVNVDSALLWWNRCKVRSRTVLWLTSDQLGHTSRLVSYIRLKLTSIITSTSFHMAFMVLEDSLVNPTYMYINQIQVTSLVIFCLRLNLNRVAWFLWPGNNW